VPEVAAITRTRWLEVSGDHHVAGSVDRYPFRSVQLCLGGWPVVAEYPFRPVPAMV
jgi:hypothetical protein